MAGFEDQLNSILGNQAAMNQIMALAKSLSGEQPAPPPQEDPPALEQAREAAYTPTAEEPAAPDLSALLEQIDPGMLQAGMDVFRQVQSAEDRNAALLNALRPFLKEDRQARLDRALRIARTAKLVRVALGALGRKEGGERV